MKLSLIIIYQLR